MGIGDRIRERRAALDMTQLDLARLLETDGMSVSRWERGAAIPRPETLVRLADLLKVQIRWLITGDGAATTTKRAAGAR